MVNSLLGLLATRQTTILSGATIIMLTVTFSKLLGLARDRLLAHIFPPDTVAIFFAAFRLPDLVFQLFIFGAISVSFIPVFTNYLENKGEKEAFDLSSSLLNLAIIILIVISTFIFLFTDLITNLIVPGFTPQQKLETANLTRIILIGQIFLAVGSLFIGILQSFRRFIVPALAGVFYNLGIIIGIIFLSEPLGIAGSAWGVVIGSILHVLIQLPFVFMLGFRFNFNFHFLSAGVREIVKLMSIRNIGLLAEQFNETIGILLASIVSTASVTYLTFATHLQMVPIGLFAATIAQAALPVLSSEGARGRMDEFKTTFLTTMHQILFLILPASAILVVLRIPAVRLTFGASQFDWEATVLTGYTLAYFSLSLTFQAANLLLVRAFYALKDTKTPVTVSLVSVFINVTLSYYFVQILGLDVWSLGVALTVSSLVSSVFLFIRLHAKVGKFDLNMVINPFLKMVIATLIMGIALYIPVKLLDQTIVDTTRTLNLFVLTSLASFFALSIYVLLVWFMKVRELDTYIDLLKKIGKIQKGIKSDEVIHEPESV